MSKVKKITVSNLKAISKLSADFNGCTAIITGGNNKGKTSFLRGLFDRVRGTKPDETLKQGEVEGFAECELTTGEKIKWEFNDKGKGFKEKLTYITEKDIRIPLTVELRNKFLPETFDVDKFLQDQPKKQRETLQKIVGLDFTDIDARYKKAYDDREAKNRRAGEEKIVLANMTEPEKIEAVNLDQLMFDKAAVRNKLNTQYLENKKANDDARKLWQDQCEDMRANVEKFNELQYDKQRAIQHIVGYRDRIIDICNEVEGLPALVDLTDLNNHIAGLPQMEPIKLYTAPDEPTYIQELPDNKELLDIEDKINAANETNRKAQLWNDYVKQSEKYKEHADLADKADADVKAIETERMNLIKSAKMPEGFSFSDDGIEYNGLSFTREQLSSSGIYIAALKLAAMNLGEVKTLHFDASFLDKNSLADIEKWANENDLQLLIERPDFEGGEIEYQLVTA